MYKGLLSDETDINKPLPHILRYYREGGVGQSRQSDRVDLPYC